MCSNSLVVSALFSTHKFSPPKPTNPVAAYRATRCSDYNYSPIHLASPRYSIFLRDHLKHAFQTNLFFVFKLSLALATPFREIPFRSFCLSYFCSHRKNPPKFFGKRKKNYVPFKKKNMRQKTMSGLSEGDERAIGVRLMCYPFERG